MDTKISGNELLTANGQHAATEIQSIRTSSNTSYSFNFQLHGEIPNFHSLLVTANLISQGN